MKTIASLIVTALLAVSALAYDPAPSETRPVNESKSNAVEQVVEHLQRISATIHSVDSQGSGILINRGGTNYVLTAGHVVNGGRSVVTFNDNSTGGTKKYSKFKHVKVVRELMSDGRSVGTLEIEAEVIAYSSPDYGHDLALLKLLKSDSTADSAEFYSGVTPSLGTKLIHVGSLLGQTGSNSVTTGIYSQQGRVLRNRVFDQTSVTAMPGSSGGLVSNEQGKVVGILLRGASDTYNLICPIRRVREWAKEHNIEFIFDAKAKADESKIKLECLEPIETESGHEKEYRTINERYPFQIFRATPFRNEPLRLR